MRAIFVSAGIIMLAACSGADPRHDAGAGKGARSSANAQLDTAGLARAYDRAAQLPRLRSFIVQWRDSVIREEYYGPGAADRRTNIKSASKSIISALTGIAIAQGKIRGTDQTIGELLPAETRGLDSLKRSITVGNLLAMQAGLEPTSFGNYGAWVQSRNWILNALGRPMVDEPGGRMLYSTGSTHLLSAIITRATGMSTHRFAQENLAGPMGIELSQWLRDPQGIYFGGNDMYMTPRDMLKVGTLYLNRGEFEGRSIVPSAWVDSSFVPRTVSPFNGNRYGYGWWMRSAGGQAIHYAWGYGGQFIFVVPGMDLVVVMTSDADATRDGGHNRELHRILEKEILSG